MVIKQSLGPCSGNICLTFQVLFEEGVRYMEEEMKEVDEKERVENPPRKVML